MNQQPNRRRSPVRGQQQQQPDGPFAIIYSRQGRAQYALPRNIRPGDAISVMRQNPAFQDIQGILQAPDTEIEVVMYSRGTIVKGPFPVKSRQQPGPVMSQNGVPIPSDNLGHLNPQNQQMPPLPEEQFDEGLFEDDRLDSGVGADYDQATAGELLRLKINSLEQQTEYLKSLVLVVDSFPIESPEELGMRELLRVGMEK